MAYKRSENEFQILKYPTCVHLRSKAMYVTGDLDPTHPDEVESHAHYCWCNKTQHIIGPDEIDVGLVECVPHRACYRERTV